MLMSINNTFIKTRYYNIINKINIKSSKSKSGSKIQTILFFVLPNLWFLILIIFLFKYNFFKLKK